MTASYLPEERGLYALADADSCIERGLNPALALAAMLRAELPWVQLRAKSFSDEQVLHCIQQATADGVSGRTRLVVNDRADLAELSGAGAVHVGQGDLPVSEVKAAFGALATGISTHDHSQLKHALQSRPDYVAFGPVFPTRSKKNPEPTTGLEALAAAHELARAAAIPLVAIGGIDEPRLEQVAPHCEYIAAISLLLPASSEAAPYAWIERRCRELNERVRRFSE